MYITNQKWKASSECHNTISHIKCHQIVRKLQIYMLPHPGYRNIFWFNASERHVKFNFTPKSRDNDVSSAQRWPATTSRQLVGLLRLWSYDSREERPQ